MNLRPTRRALLDLLGDTTAVIVADRALSSGPRTLSPKQIPRTGEFVTFLDEMTETPVVRLTSLDSASFMPSRNNRAVSVKGRFLVFSSDRTGLLSPFRLDLKSGQIVQLLSTSKLDGRSLTMDQAGRLLFFLDGRVLKQLSLTGKKVQTVAEDVSQFSLGVSAQEIVFIRNGRLIKAGVKDIVLAEGAIWCQIRPGNGACLFSRKSSNAGEEELWFTSFEDPQTAVRLAESPISAPCWSPDGGSALFLREGAIHEIPLITRAERKLGGLSHFVAFSPNTDSSVFVGAVRSKAQPTVNLLLRNPPREFTLCEHRASHPDECSPVFSADSRRIYFNSDFQGKPSIYSVNVEQLIEETSG